LAPILFLQRGNFELVLNRLGTRLSQRLLRNASPTKISFLYLASPSSFGSRAMLMAMRRASPAVSTFA
jgi:hypothetical protein